VENSTPSYVLDSFAILAYLEGEAGADQVSSLLALLVWRFRGERASVRSVSRSSSGSDVGKLLSGGHYFGIKARNYREETQRKPTKLTLKSGAAQRREAERTPSSLKNHEPPRSTRPSPDDGPLGFRDGELL